jgi:hypothetical protein
VGRSYPPEFYSWIKVPRVRRLFEQIATETEEDFQKIISICEKFSVKILRPNLPVDTFQNNQFVSPPMTPRDHMVMIGNTFYEKYSTNFDKTTYDNIKDSAWPECNSWNEFNNLPIGIQNECKEIFNFGLTQIFRDEYNDIFQYIKKQGNIVKSGHLWIDGAMVARVGKDLFFGTASSDADVEKSKILIDREFGETRNHLINTAGHSDATYCPVCPGLIISLHDIPTYAETFPGWEVIYLPNQSWDKVKPFLYLKGKNQGRWWIPGFEYDQKVLETVETWLSHWVGYVEETVFDVNMLILDPQNVLVFNENDLVFDAFRRYNITPHVATFRHRYFWDGGVHCVTTDLDRSGAMQDFFSQTT